MDVGLSRAYVWFVYVHVVTGLPGVWLLGVGVGGEGWVAVRESSCWLGERGVRRRHFGSLVARLVGGRGWGGGRGRSLGVWLLGGGGGQFGSLVVRWVVG